MTSGGRAARRAARMHPPAMDAEPLPPARAARKERRARTLTGPTEPSDVIEDPTDARRRQPLRPPDRPRQAPLARPSPTGRTGPARGRCSRRSASPTRTSPSRSSASATTWIETMPCNFNQRRLAEFVKEGIRAAGGTPMEFNTISVSDGVTMGTEGMKASPHQPRGHRRLDRARRPRPPVRRRRLPRRLRQDDARRGDGPRPARRPGPRPLQRHDLSRACTRASATRPS